jgi:hypothetical protein
MKSIWQIELAEEENSRNQHDEMTARTLGCSKIQDIAFKSRENKHGDFFPIGSLAHFAGSLLVMLKSLQLEHVQKVFANHVSSFRRTAMTLGVTTEHESLRSSFPNAFSGNPVFSRTSWTPAFAGVTMGGPCCIRKHFEMH